MRWRRRPRKDRVTPPAQRILLPLLGEHISPETLDAALRLARAEGAVLVPVYLVTVPLYMELDAPAPEHAAHALPVLEMIEQRAARLKVPVDARVEVARSPRHGLHELIEGERFDRLVVPAATHTSEGFSPEDVEWLLEHGPGEITVLRPADQPSSRSR